MAPDAADRVIRDRVTRALLAQIRQQFDAPVGTIIGFAEILLEDAAAQQAGDLIPDLQQILAAGRQLRSLLDELRAPAAAAGDSETDDPEAFRAKLRHELRTPLNAVKGYGEMLRDDAAERGLGGFVGDLDRLLAAADGLLGQIDSIVRFSAPPEETAAIDPAAAAPASSLARALVETIRTAAADAAPSRDAGRAAAILVVDDNQMNRDMLSRRLERDGHSVTAAASGAEALARLEAASFDLVLLDLLMPGMNGFQVLLRLKGEPRWRDLPVIMISALDDIDSIVRCIEAGAEDYLPKPFNPVLLRARIGASLERKRLRDRERAEKATSEALLLNILPKPIVERLGRGETLIADRFDRATVLFCDLAGFTALSARAAPAVVIEILNGMFSAFDQLAAPLGLEKIKTIGDAYMVVGGLPEPLPDHEAAVAEMALAMRAAVRELSGRFGQELAVRIGIHTGPVVAGIIGRHKFAYDVWGDTVNIASRMESHGLPGEIHVTAALRDALGARYLFAPRGEIPVKGKGTMSTYLLKDRTR